MTRDLIRDYRNMLAAAPTGYVPVKRELLKEVADALTFMTLNRLSDELRALLSPAPKDEAK